MTLPPQEPSSLRAEMASLLGDRIDVLPPLLSEKIAAGEVIERPASVLKELVENAIDAGATHITVDIEDTGFALIRVADNGRGMSHQNLVKSVLRYATSKVHTLEDLEAIHTLGFRGEALASIVAVSRVEIESSSSDEGLGHRLTLEGGVVSQSAPCPRPRGTTVSVRDLFYNTPARKKFMKSRKSERMFLTRLVEQMATPFTAVHFTVVIDGRSVLDASVTRSIPERIGQYAGAQYGHDLIGCEGTMGEARITVLLSPPAAASPRPRFQDLYVNCRRVDNDAVTFAIRNACRPFIPADGRPAFFCLVEIDPRRVDVNIHPTKQRVKFEDERALAGSVHRIVERGLRAALEPQTAMAGTPTDSPAVWPVCDAFVVPPLSGNDVGGEGGLRGSGRIGAMVAEDGPGEPADDEQLVLPFGPSAATMELPGDAPPTSRAQAVREAGWDLIQCYQIHALFILAPIKNGILLIDQHAAHERILFEQALDSLAQGKAASQHLLFPIVVELSSAEKSVIEPSQPYFRAFGYELHDFGGNAVSVAAIPAFMRDSQVEAAIREMVAYLLDEATMQTFPQPQMRYAAAFACGSAVRAGQELSREEMSGLLNALFATRNPYTCPHGRPTVIRLSLDELRRRFLR